MSKLDIHKLKNGMVLLGERIDHVQSVSFQFLIPAGAALLPEGCQGAGEVISDWIFRGAGDRDSRQLMEILDGLGIHRHTGVTAEHLLISGSMESGSLYGALDIFADIILRPKRDTAQFALAREQAVNELLGLDDDPRDKVMVHLKEQFYPDPYGRSPLGEMSELQALTAQTAGEIIERCFVPSQLIFSISGKYDFDAVCRQMEALFDIDRPYAPAAITPEYRGQRYLHVPSQGAQVHIGLMTAVPPIGGGCYYELMAAVSILSGSMSSRLFTEVREKRGLCYAVGARYRSMKDYAGISCYAGTTPEKAQETLDVIIEQFNLLKNGISDDEMQRAKVGLKTSLIMQCESTSSRSAGLGSDYYLLGRVRSVDEIRDNIASLNPARITETLQQHPFDNYTVVTIGPKAITL
jgi:predicted Zn-dependent peptidase